MSISPKTSKNIEKLVQLFVNYLKYKSLGPHSISKSDLTELLLHKWITPNDKSHYSIAESYASGHARAATDGEFAPMSSRQGSINFLENMTKRYLDKAGAELKADIVSIIDANLMPFKDKNEGKLIYDLLSDPKMKGKYLGEALHGKVENWRHRYSTIVRTEKARASNFGALSAILHNNPDKNPEDICVFKAGRNAHDPSCCNHCKKFWFESDGITPKVYSVSELVSNGSNIGRKAAEWLPTIDSTHPNCSHHLVELRDGYTIENGDLKYVSKDFKYKK